MKLIKSTKWARKWFDAESIPAPGTIAGWIDSGFVPGTVIGETAYIDENEWLKRVCTKDRKIVNSDARSLGNPLLGA